MKLSDIELHDMPLKELLLFLEIQEIAIVFYNYVDEEEKYITQTPNSSSSVAKPEPRDEDGWSGICHAVVFIHKPSKRH